MATPNIILASTSPYRRELLGKLGLRFETAAPGVAETPLPGEHPAALARRLAEAKALAVARGFPGSLIVGSDQVAVLDGEQLGKPMHRDNAIAQLRKASGRPVAFYTALCVMDSASLETKTEMDLCRVVFRTLSTDQIERYVDRDRPYDCAGGFKSEGLGIALFERFEGEDPNALVGLPLIRLTRLLEAFGVAVL